MDGYGPTEVDLSGGREFDLGQFGLVLVLDLTDDLLDHIFEGQDPGGSPELVDDDGHMEPFSLHLEEEPLYRFAIRYEDQGPDERIDLLLLSLPLRSPDRNTLAQQRCC